MKVLCAIPCFDEEVAIGSVVLKAGRHADEVVVVDDGSSDRTNEVAELAGATVLRHAENLGKGAAYRSLWRYARQADFDALVVLDGDGQHDADEVPLLLRQIEAGADIVIGARWGTTTEMPLWRRAGKRVLDYGTAIAARRGNESGGPALTDSQSGFRAYSRRALDAIGPHGAGFSVESQLIIDAHEKGLRFAETRIHCRYDVEGSTLGGVQHASGVLNDILVAIGIRHPLLFLALPGTLAAILGIAAGGYAIILHQLQGVFAPAWVLLGIFLTLIGVLGVFAGMVFNVLPRSLRRVMQEERD